MERGGRSSSLLNGEARGERPSEGVNVEMTMVWTSLTRVTKKWLGTGYWNKVQDSTKAPRTGPRRSFSLLRPCGTAKCDCDLRTVIHVIMHET